MSRRACQEALISLVLLTSLANASRDTSLHVATVKAWLAGSRVAYSVCGCLGVQNNVQAHMAAVDHAVARFNRLHAVHNG